MRRIYTTFHGILILTPFMRWLSLLLFFLHSYFDIKTYKMELESLIPFTWNRKLFKAELSAFFGGKNVMKILFLEKLSYFLPICPRNLLFSAPQQYIYDIELFPREAEARSQERKRERERKKVWRIKVEKRRFYRWYPRRWEGLFCQESMADGQSAVSHWRYIRMVPLSHYPL